MNSSVTAIDVTDAMAVLRGRYRNVFGPRTPQPQALEVA